MDIDEKKLVFSKGEFDVICHDDGHVDISAGDKLLLQLPEEQFNEIVHKRRMLILGE